MINEQGLRRGPILPYSLVAGVTPCPGGWLVASAKVQGTVFAPEQPMKLDTFVDVLDQRPAYSAIALNAPIGWPDKSVPRGRTCDREARALLGHRGSSIKSAPVRTDDGRDIDLLPDHMDAITRTLLPKYREVASEMAPFRQRSVYEVHSDLSFYQMNGQKPLEWSKETSKGVQERRALLEKNIHGVERVLDAELPGVSLAHLLDVAAFMWTARRIFARSGLRIPADPEWDDQGLRMEMVR